MIPNTPIDANTSNEENAAIKGGPCASAPTTCHFLVFVRPAPRIRSTAMIVIRRYAWMRPTQTMGFCCMKPNGPIPIIQPMVVAAALPSATRVKIVP